MELKVGTSYKKTPYIGTIYGKGGTGKTGIAVYAPNPFFIVLEHGSKWIFGNKQLENVAQTFVDDKSNIMMPKNQEEFFTMVRWLCNRDNLKSLERTISTVVIDGMAFLERMFYQDLVLRYPEKNGKPVLDIVDLGYDGQLKAMEYWEKLFTGAETLRRVGLNVIFITHAILKNTDNSDGTRYKYIDMELQAFGNANVPNLFAKRSDFVYYIDCQVTTSTQGAGNWKRSVANGRNESVYQVHTRQTPLFYAKSRSVDGSLIPDVYTFDLQDREAVTKQIFEDLDKC